MSKLCPICNQITNCTDNCNACIAEEKAYMLYVWFDEDEGGYGVCKSEEFSSRRGCRYERVGNFDTFEELTSLILADDFDLTRERAEMYAKSLMDALK